MAAEIALIRGRIKQVRDLARKIADRQARLGLLDYASNLEGRASEFEARMAALTASSNTDAD